MPTISSCEAYIYYITMIVIIVSTVYLCCKLTCVEGETGVPLD